MKIIHVGINNEFKKINDAIKSINEPTLILLDDEEYFEKVIVDKDNVIIDGQNKAKINYNDYAKKIHQDGTEYVTFRTYTMLVKGRHVTLRNLTIENSAGEGPDIGQAVALHLYNDDITCINCTLLARQDTLFCGPFSPDLIERYIPILPRDERVHNGEFHQRFISCTIKGTVDFIFGGASADFIDCNIVSLSTYRDTWVVAPDHDKENQYGMNFINCRFLKEEGTKDESVYLARPWREYGMCHFIDCYLDTHIKKEGFSIWVGTDRHVNSRFYETGSFGPGSENISRVDWMRK